MNFRTTSLTFLLSFFIFYPLFAQKATLQGTVKDLENSEPLIAATVKVGATGVVTDINGNFAITLDPGEYEVEISYVGYEPFRGNVELTAGVVETLKVDLKAEVTVLNTFTVTAGKFKKPIGEVTVSLEVIQPALVESNSQRSMEDVIQKIPGLIVVDGQANIRGGSGFSQGAGSRVLVLVDDVPMLQADAAIPNWDDFPLENFSQIEVLKGSASALYGSSALNGIINIRTTYPTTEPETKGAVFSTLFMSPRREELKWWDSDSVSTTPYALVSYLTHKQKFGKFDLVLGGFYRNEASFRQDTYKKYGRFTVNTRYRLSDRLSFGINANFNKGHSNNYFYWASYPDALTGARGTFSENERTRWNIDPYITFFDKTGNRHKFLGRYYRVDNKVSANRANSSHQYYAEYQFQRQFPRLNIVTTAGIVTLGSTVTAQLYGDTTFTSRNYAGYLQFDKEFGERVNFSLGFRYERNLLENPGFQYVFANKLETVEPSEERESKPVFRAGLNYRLTDYTFLRGSFGQGYRYPSIAEKFIFTDVGGFFVTPNPTLTSETGWTAEIGIKQGFKVSALEGFLDIAAFWSRYSDMMEFNLVGFSFRSTNIGSTEIKGYEISLTGRGEFFGVNTSVLAGYYYIDPQFLEFDNTLPGPFETPTQGQTNALNSSSDDNILKYRPRHNFKLDIQSEYKRFSAGGSVFHASHIEAIDALFLLIVKGLNQWRIENDKGFTVVGFRAGYQLTDHLKFSLLLDNAFNQEYAIRPALMDAPRNLTARLDFKF